VTIWYRTMAARDAAESHRVATPLELLFDLCFVVAVAQVSTQWHHALVEGDVVRGLAGYLTVFFGIFWAWLNFTWFASAYDTDDVIYRLTTFVQIAGVLILAAGVPRAFGTSNFGVIVAGYVVMRVALAGQWLRVAFSDPPRRTTGLRFAGGIVVVQAGWITLWALHLSFAAWLTGFAVLVVAEMIVPIWAERAEPTTWHPHHIAERYGLFTIIVLGETILSATVAIQVGFDLGGRLTDLVVVAASGLVIVFSMWWLYFDRPAAYRLSNTSMFAFAWGYGHYVVFASAAAVGAGLAVNVDVVKHLAHISRRSASWAVAIPVALFLGALWLLLVRPRHRLAYAIAVPAVLLTPFLGAAALPAIAAIGAALVTTVVLGHRPDSR
jgi:low temperature requirement protein LtrA